MKMLIKITNNAHENKDQDKYPATVPFLTMPGPMQKQKAKSSEAITKGFYNHD